MLSGSIAFLIVRITLTASPCSATRKSILPQPIPCSPVQVLRFLAQSARVQARLSLATTLPIVATVWPWPAMICIREMSLPIARSRSLGAPQSGQRTVVISRVYQSLNPSARLFISRKAHAGLRRSGRGRSLLPLFLNCAKVAQVARTLYFSGFG
jgi:hypothetical protein